MKNWKTTLAAILGLVAIASTQASAMLDADPETVANWQMVIAGIVPCIGLIFAGDAQKKEE